MRIRHVAQQLEPWQWDPHALWIRPVLDLSPVHFTSQSMPNTHLISELFEGLFPGQARAELGIQVRLQR